MKKKKYNTRDIEYSASNEEEWERELSDEAEIYNESDDEEDEYSDEEDEDISNEISVVSQRDTIKVEVESISTGPKKRGPKPLRTEFYVEPKEFDEHIIKYYNSGDLTNELATMVSKIAHKLSYAPNFINYTYREEMVGDAIVRMMKALTAKKYCHIKGKNPFSYFTKIAFNAFRNRIKREKHMHEALQRYREDILLAEMQPNNFKNKNGIEKFASQED